MIAEPEAQPACPWSRSGRLVMDAANEAVVIIMPRRDPATERAIGDLVIAAPQMMLSLAALLEWASDPERPAEMLERIVEHAGEAVARASGRR